jgi:cob(I)alamin adenosyltransferase
MRVERHEIRLHFKTGDGMKVYTGKGYQGKTSLFSGERVPKSHERVEACGDVDELNSMIGALVAVLPESEKFLTKDLQKIQVDLFHIGSWLATTPDSPKMDFIKGMTKNHTEGLEAAIDRMDEKLPKIEDFILPGGHISSALGHIARTVCRRAERHIVRLSAESLEGRALEQIQALLTYMNRLSAYLFMVSRYCNVIQGVSDVAWEAVA